MSRLMFRALPVVACATLLGGLPVTAVAAPAHPVSVPKCFGKKPGFVVTRAHQTLTLTKRNRNAVVDLLGAGDTLNATKAAGNTYVCDTGGARSITTGNGNDKVSIRNGSPAVSTGKGNDYFVQTGTGNPVVHLGAGNDIGLLGKGNGVLYGDDGNDILRAGSGTTGKRGSQKLNGGNGSDVLYAGNATATLDGGVGGTNYLVSTSQAKHTKVILHPGDRLNGVLVGSPAAAPVTAPAAPAAPIPPAVPPLPSSIGGIVAMGPEGTDTGYSTVTDQLPVGPVTVFTLSGQPGSPGQTVSGWSLSFGDGSPGISGIGEPPSTYDHNYLAPGAFTAVLGLTDNQGRTVTFPTTVDVSGDPSGGLTLDHNSLVLSGGTATVTGTFTGTPGSRAAFVTSSIDYGDNSPTVTTNGAPGAISHTYQAAGTYQIFLAASTDHGATTTAEAFVTVTDGTPHASLYLQAYGASPVQGSVLTTSGNPLGLDTSRSVASTGKILTGTTVDPGDGSGAADQTAHTYTSSGQFTATATATESSGSGTTSSTTTATVTVAAAPAQRPTITAPESVAVGSPVSFATTDEHGTAPNVSGAPADTVVSRVVDFGDGSPQVTPKAGLGVVGGPTNSSTTHTYTTPGLYYVSYTTDDSYHDMFIVQTTVLVTTATPYLQLLDPTSVEPSPWYPVKAGVSSQVAYLVGFGSTGSADGAAYSVDYGDGTAPTTGTFDGTGEASTADSHSYAPGEFTLTVKVTDTAGRTVVQTAHISAAALPAVTLGNLAFNSSSATLTIPVSAFAIGSNAGANDYQLVVTQGSGGNAPEVFDRTVHGTPPASFAVPTGSNTGPFTATLAVVNDHYLSATATAST